MCGALVSHGLILTVCIRIAVWWNLFDDQDHKKGGGEVIIMILLYSKWYFRCEPCTGALTNWGSEGETYLKSRGVLGSRKKKRGIYKWRSVGFSFLIVDVTMVRNLKNTTTMSIWLVVGKYSILRENSQIKFYFSDIFNQHMASPSILSKISPVEDPPQFSYTVY